ncbi:MAG: YIP1 family protein [Myxococcaceae bacterium]|nr:YIP1 family protein [Myxococcaceae bacterium]
MTPAKCAVHREADALGPCPRCGNFVCGLCAEGRAELVCARCFALSPEAGRQPIAWERRRELGALSALWQTWKESMFAPDPFFKKVMPNGKVSDAALYAFVMTVLMIGPNFMQQALSGKQTVETLKTMFRSVEWLQALTWWRYAGGAAVASVVLFPLFFFLGAAFFHGCAVLAGAREGGFNGTARLMGYSYGAMASYVVPYVGPMLTVYYFALIVIGMMRVHRVTVWRALVASLLIPGIVISCASCGLAFLIIDLMRPMLQR